MAAGVTDTLTEIVLAMKLTRRGQWTHVELGVASALVLTVDFPGESTRAFSWSTTSFFSLAPLMAPTLVFWEAGASGQRAYMTAQLMSGLVTFPSAYQYRRIFNLSLHELAVGGANTMTKIVLAMNLARWRLRTHA